VHGLRWHGCIAVEEITEEGLDVVVGAVLLLGLLLGRADTLAGCASLVLFGSPVRLCLYHRVAGRRRPPCLRWSTRWQLVEADCRISHLVSTASGGCNAIENRATTLVLSGGGNIMRCYLVEGIIVATFFKSLGLFRGKP
jgi:hypothetical protein